MRDLRRLTSVKPVVLLPFSISVTFHDEKDDSTKTVQVPLGQSLLEAAHANDVDLEGEAKSRSQKPLVQNLIA